MRLHLIFTAIFFALIQPISLVHAETISLEVSGNGAGSENTIENHSEQESTVEQNNQSEVTNDIQSESNTGENEVNGNTAETTSLETGSIEQHVEVVNENINQNTVSTSGCSECNESSTSGAEIKVVGNGSNTVNTVDVQHNSQTNVSQNNTAVINTSVTIKANTGNNTIKNNTGSQISVSTGHIKSQTNIVNKDINNSQATINSNGSVSPLSVKIAGNGTGSVNTLVIDTTRNIAYVSNNYANISNSVYENFNTGGNYINSNTASNISLVTGDILSSIGVNNIGINSNQVIITDCNCDNPDDDDDDDDNGNGGDNGGEDNGGSDNGGGDNGGGSSDNGSGGIGGASNDIGSVLGATLPATGGSLLYLLGGNLAMFLTGLWMKLKENILGLVQSELLVTIEVV